MGINRPETRRRLGLALALAWMAVVGVPTVATAQQIRTLLVATPNTDAASEAIASGFAHWLTLRIASTGLKGRVATPTTPDLRSALDQALVTGADYVVVPDLRVDDGQLQVRLRLYGPNSDELLGAARAEAPLASLGEAAAESADALLSQIGVTASGAPPLLDELATSSRAIDLVRRGELARAFREVQGKLSPTAMNLRDAIADMKDQTDVPSVERARLLAATGNDRKAWGLIAEEVKRQAKSVAPERKLMLAAAEVQLARQKPAKARKYLDRLVAMNAEDADAQLDLGLAHWQQKDAPQARQALELAATLDPDDPRPLEALEEIPSGDADQEAAVLLRIAEQESQRFNLSRAEKLYDRAAELSPARKAEVAQGRARMNERVGRHAEALGAWRVAVERDRKSAEAWTGLGRVQRLTGDSGAQKSLERAIALDPNNTGALSELGKLHVDFGRAALAEPVLRKALESEPRNAEVRRDLARALQANGKPAEALDVLVGPEAGPAGAKTLQQAARIQREMGDLDGARKSLDRAIALEPFDGELHEEMAVTLEAAGEAESADSAMQEAISLDGLVETTEEVAVEPVVAGGPNLDDLVLGFSSQVSRASSRTVAHMGMRQQWHWRAIAERWLMPRVTDEDALVAALERSLSLRFQLAEPTRPDTAAFDQALDRLYDFGDRTSLDARSIADVNALLGTDAIFLSRIVRHPAERGEETGACADPARIELEVRMLSGTHVDLVNILADAECLPGPMEAYGVWNLRAAGVYAVLLVLLVGPILRGFGTIVVEINLPPRTKGFLDIRISTTTMSAEQSKKKKAKKLGSGMKMSLRNFSRYRKQMAHRETVFRWIPARRQAYYVFVNGPLFDAMGEAEIGHFLEEQRAQVERGQTTRLKYDLNPSECALQVTVLMNRQPVQTARVAVREQADSLRYARGGAAYFVVGKGTYSVIVGLEDRATERVVTVENVERAIPVEIDLADDSLCMVRNCPEAVEPYLLGDFGTAATALEAAGETQLAHLMRGAYHQQRGENDLAADEFEAAGCIEEAAALRAEGLDQGKAADLFEKAGDYERAADAHREAGDLNDAGRCYELAYDYDQALECYEEVGNVPKAIEIHETVGAYLDAAHLCRTEGQIDRALSNLQNIEKRDPSFGEALRLMGEILLDRGDFDVAAEKLSEAISFAGGENAPVDLHELHARALSQGDDKQAALQAYQTVRRLDPSRDDVTRHIDALKEQIAQTRVAAGPASVGATDELESRYELLGELGRGGMGVVYKARDKRLNRIIALKRLPDNLRDNETAARLFLREAQAAAALNHTNITTIYDAGEENGVFHITMELLDGLAINQIQERHGVVSVRDATRLGMQVCAGLDYAHRQRIVHRDIKPANLFFTTDKIVKIMDFGLAKTIEEVRKTSTMIGGTPYYMAPEQAAGEAVDNRTDLYAFGVTLYRMTTGGFPFSEGDLAYHHRHTPPPDPRETKSDLDPGMAELILELIQKDPDARPASAADVAQRLQAIFKAIQA
jgi:tetratricopeptide (TPR) repeat protein